MAKHDHSGRFLKIDQYAVRSGLSEVNPDFKVMVGCVSLILCIISEKGITSILTACCMTWLTLCRGRIRAAEYIRFLLVPLLFIVLSGIVLLVDISASGLGFIDIPAGRWYLSITRESLSDTALVSLRAVAGVTCLYMISLSTPVYEMIGVLRRAHIPAVMIELMYLIYRFIFLLLDSYERMKTSAQTRLGYCNLRRSYTSFFGICTNLLVIALGKASKSFDSMESRGYDGKLVFLETSKKITRTQALAAGIYLTVAVVVLWAEWRFL